ncbi:hypothetical protein I302_101260 [Kwoniella bestiolae CBS 10118]|uniref:SWIM-type domain-containing protein n=1 Tax=Kwoniella bestiolae CBS 10118 TaxID=1296100 RepID=A0A1B9G7F8_9TREE|nr:hypothetical protein I302_04634 [Kwoniella bestiolae CBS 10118]OCF26943.1 hypothetical protein I302_04634 [Kwoniella bestiolae CBS 10118]
MVEPSSSFLVLVATLLDSLPPSLPIPDTLLLQLHAIFGGMLLSALQLVDKREVVRVTLPSDRYVYQVASSSGKSYTIHLTPPPPSPIDITDIPIHVPTSAPISPELEPGPDLSDLPPASIGESIPRTPSPPTHDQAQTFNPLLSSPPQHSPSPPLEIEAEDEAEVAPVRIQKSTVDQKEELRRERIRKLAIDLQAMYCPCAGWSYGCLAGERTILCKHLLAIIIASKTGREVQAEVDQRGVAGLLGLS